jgi:ligand-binding sensor domain-containing protein
MKTASSRRLTRALPFVLLASLFLPGVSAGAGKWTSYVDPSLISDIVLRDGKLYMATTGGLVVYQISDETFEQFTNTAGLPSNFLTCLMFDEAGRLWVGTEKSGVARLDERPGGFEVTPLNSTFHGLSDDRITDLAAWGDTLVYATKEGAGLIIEDFPGPRFLERNGLPSDVVNAVLPDGDRVWMATDKGVVFLDKFGFIRNPTDTLFAAFALERTDTALWAGTENGVACLRDGAAAWTFTQLEASPRPVFSLSFDGVRLWAGARARFFTNDGSGWIQHEIFDYYTKYDLNNRLSEIRGLQPMPGGTAYFGAGEPLGQRRGIHLVYFDGATTRGIPFKGIPMNRLSRLAFDVDGSLWISTGGAGQGFGVAKLTPSGEWVAYNKAAGDTNLSWPNNLTLLPDSQGSKWFARQAYPAFATPLDELQDQLDTNSANDVWFHYRVGEGGGDGLGSLRNQDAVEDPAGNRWFLSDADLKYAPGQWGINILSRDKSAWRQVNPTSTDPSGQLLGMKGGNVTDVAFGADGVAYVAMKTYGVQRWTTGGFDQTHLFDLSDDTWTTIASVGAQDGIASGANILSLALRSDGVLWIGTDIGLYRYEPGRSLAYIPRDTGFGAGLLGSRVIDVVLDRDENLWVATELGLDRIARDDNNDITPFTTPTAWQTQLSLFFPPSAVSPIVDAACERLALHPSKNLLYIATANGLSELDISSLEEKGLGLTKMYVYPNPIRASRGDSSLKIANIDAEVLVEVFTIEGELVHSQRANRSGDPVWDLTTQSAFLAASGVYIVRISGSGDTVIKMVSILR